MASPIFPHKQSIAFVSPGDWDCPSVELRKPIYEAKAPSHTVIIEGTTDLDTKFFRSHSPSASSSSVTPFSITVALLSNSSFTPLDWNQEHPSQCLLSSSTPNPKSCIKLLPRITVDRQLVCVNFTIEVGPELLARAGGEGKASKMQYEFQNGSAGGMLWREFGVAIKAYDAEGRTSQTNIAQFVVRCPTSAIPPPWVAASPASVPMGKTPSNSNSVKAPQQGSLARRVSIALGAVKGRKGRRRSSAGNTGAKGQVIPVVPAMPAGFVAVSIPGQRRQSVGRRSGGR